jgi:conjugative transfer signal peptidase TraF
MLMRLIPAAAVTAFCAASFWQIISPPTPKLIYNKTISAPIGWYAVESKRPLKRDDLVAAFAPAEARKLADDRGYLPEFVPLIKTVWATEGERVCHDGLSVRVPNRPDISVIGQDGLGRAMPVISGCYTLNADEVFLVSTDVQTSWDSRYFGVVSEDLIVGPVRFLGKELAGSARAGHGFWRGGQDKRREASLGAIPLSAHHFWGGFGFEREAPQFSERRGAMGSFGSPPEYGTTRKLPGTL